MKKEALLRIICIGIWLVFFSACFFITPSSPLANDKIILKCATYTGDVSVHHHVVQWWAAELEKRSKGKVIVKIFASGSLVKANDMLKAGSSGLADIVQIVPAYDPSILVLSGAPYKPFNTPPRADQFGLAFNELAKNQHVINEFDSLNIVYMFLNPSGSYNIMGRKPVRVLADLKGLKVRTVGDYSMLFKELGAVPVSTTAPEIYSAMEKGIVDTIVGSGHHWMYSYKVAEASKNGYYTDNLDMGYAYTIEVMNKNTYNSLPKEVKQILDELRSEMPKRAQEIQFSAMLDQKYYDIFKELKIQIVKFPTKDRDIMVAKQNELLEKWINDLGLKGSKMSGVMTEWNKIIAEVIAKYPKGV